MWDTWVQSLCWEDPLEKEMATRSSTLAWKIPLVEEPGRLQSMESQRVGHDWATFLPLFSLLLRVLGVGGIFRVHAGIISPLMVARRALQPAMSIGALEHRDLLAGGECTTRVRWAVSNVTSASGKQRSLEHFSWPSLHNHPRFQLMWFWKMLLFHSPKYLGKKKGIKLTWWLAFSPRPLRRFLFKTLHMFPFIILLAKKGIWTYGIIIMAHQANPTLRTISVHTLN